MLKLMRADTEARVLLLDCCGDEPLIALFAGDDAGSREVLRSREAAAEWLPAVKRVLGAQGWRLNELDAVGVVAGPGSFTGVRTSVSAAKGLCEAAGLPLALVSRLAILADAAEGAMQVVPVLYAGRDQVYARLPADATGPARELLLTITELRSQVGKHPVVITEPRLKESLQELNPNWVVINPRDILTAVRAALHAGGSDVATADASYVRSEASIYAKPESVQAAARTGQG